MRPRLWSAPSSAAVAVVTGLVGAVVVAWPAFDAWTGTGFGDWQQFHHWSQTALVAFFRHGELPLWDPHHCGGVPHWGNPQAQFLAPTWLATEGIFGTAPGHKLFIVGHYAAAFSGFYLLLRPSQGTAGALTAAAAWAFGAALAWRGAGGHGALLPFAYFPWLLWAGDRARVDARYRVVAAGVLALVFFEGGFIPAPFLVLAWLLHTLVDQRSWRSPRATFASVGVALGLAALLSAVRWWPVLRLLRRYPRPTTAGDPSSLGVVLHSLTAREPQPWEWDHHYVWAEYGAYVGALLLALAVVGGAQALRDRRHRPALFGAVAFGALALGNVGPWSPWRLLHLVPPFDHMQAPSRMHLFLSFYLAWLGGVGVWTLLGWLRRTTPSSPRLVAAVGLCVAAAVALDVGSNSRAIHAERWDGLGLDWPVPEPYHLVAGGNYLAEFARYPGRGVGTTRCYDPVPWRVSSELWSGPGPQARLSPPEAGRVIHEAGTNHTLTTRVELSRPGRLIYNQNADPDWTVDVGRAAVDRGRLATDLPAGAHTIHAAYAPADLPWSALVSLLGLFAGAAVWWRGRPGAISPSSPRR